MRVVVPAAGAGARAEGKMLQVQPEGDIHGTQ